IRTQKVHLRMESVMIERFSFFDWAAGQTQPGSSLYGMLEFVAQQRLDSWRYAGVMLLVVFLGRKIPRERIMQFVVGLLCAAATLLRFDAARWSGTLPASPADVFLDLILGLIIPVC